MEEKLKKGGLVADIGCGYGASTMVMAEAYPKSKFFGFDFHHPSIMHARKVAEESGFPNVRFETVTARKSPGTEYDLVAFFDCLHDMGDPVGAARMNRRTSNLSLIMRGCGKPIIARVKGYAVGGGNELQMLCDLTIASEDSKFGQAGPKMGSVPVWWGTQLLPRIVGLGRATEWLFLGDGIDAETALAAGLAHRVVVVEEVLPTALALAQRLVAGPALAIGMTKRLLNNEANMDLSAAIEQEAVAQAYLLRADDHRRFYEAWREGRQPEFEGR